MDEKGYYPFPPTEEQVAAHRAGATKLGLSHAEYEQRVVAKARQWATPDGDD